MQSDNLKQRADSLYLLSTKTGKKLGNPSTEDGSVTLVLENIDTTHLIAGEATNFHKKARNVST